MFIDLEEPKVRTPLRSAMFAVRFRFQFNHATSTFLRSCEREHRTPKECLIPLSISIYKHLTPPE